MKSLVWIASYPKSGSTWIRALLAAYLAAPGRDATVLDDVAAMPHAAMRALFDALAGFASARLPWEQVDPLRPVFYRHLAAQGDEPRFLKIHDRRRDVAGGEALCPPEATRAVVYVVRDPRDVAVSCAAHLDIDIDSAIAFMNDPEACLAPEGDALHDQFPQPLGRWSDHVASWVEDSPLPTLVLRYEDLHTAPVASFGKLLAAVGLSRDVLRLHGAVVRAGFAALAGEEQARGFVEQRGRSAFFRQGIVGGGRASLSRGQRARLERDHGAVMARFGYTVDD